MSEFVFEIDSYKQDGSKDKVVNHGVIAENEFVARRKLVMMFHLNGWFIRSVTLKEVNPTQK